MNPEHDIDVRFTEDRRGLSRRRATGLAVAGLLAGLALAPTSALANHPTSGDGGTSTSGDTWNYRYDLPQRKEAMARVQETNEARASSNASERASGFLNTWSYMYDTGQGHEQVARHRLPPAKARHDSVPRDKAHPALAYIVVAVSGSGPGAEATCYIPETLDQWTRRLIAVQFCSKAHIVPADLPTLVPYGALVPQAVGHCGHHVLHQPPKASDLPVSAWYTPTSC